jgi:tetratricopeptide (TPR) repeat protein
MDLTTLTMLVMLAMAAVGLDTVWHPTEVILEASAGKIDKATIDENMINGILKSEVDRISSTPTLMAKPRVKLASQGGIGMAIASAANMQSVAYALQSKVGIQPDQIRIALFSEDGAIKVLVTGSGGQRVRSFEQQVEQQKGETVVALLHRAALVGMSRIDPYLTALDLMQRHAGDEDFSDAETLINFAKSQIPPTPLSVDRSLFENLQGILALFRGNQNDAHTWFGLATKSDPKNTAAVLNLAFAHLQIGEFREAAEGMDQLLHETPTFDRILIGTAYVTWGAALLGLHDVNGADHVLAKAVDANPTSAIAWDMWSAVKREKGDAAQSDQLHQQALGVSGNFDNYAEVAALYFQLAWQNNQPIVRSRFANPAVVSVH